MAGVPDYDSLLSSALEGYRELKKGERTAQCPWHEDSRASLSINVDKGVFICHAGCGRGSLTQLFKRLNLALPRGIVATYSYQNEDGEELLQVVRYSPKSFRQRRPGPNDTWIWDAAGVRKVLYNLQGLLEVGDDEPLAFVVEGEKDADALIALGLNATTNLGGAGKWLDDYSGSLKGFHVVILPDNDSVGAEHARTVAESVRPYARSVKILRLSGLPEKGDVSDWLDAGGDRDTLLKLVQDCPLLSAQPTSGASVEAASKALHKIRADEGDLERATKAAWAAIRDMNEPPKLFRRGGEVVRVEIGDGGRAVVGTLDNAGMRYYLARGARWVRVTAHGEQLVIPPKHVVEDVLASPDKPIPILGRIVEAPAFAYDGSVNVAPGYHERNKTLYVPPTGFHLPVLPASPSGAEVARASRLIKDDLLRDFPFAGEADLCHAVALMLLPFVRDMIDGPTPLHLIEAPGPGTGKTLLADVLTIPFLGRSSPSIPAATNDEEWRKRITAILRGSPSMILLDNVSQQVNSAALAAALTTESWMDRVLAQSATIELPNRAAWVMTGNNPALSHEMARRSVRIRLDSREEHPWLRGGFKHPALKQWVLHNRPALIQAALLLALKWVVAGRPRWRGTRLGMFEEWSGVLGGILDLAGFKGFLGNLKDLYEGVDHEALMLQAFVESWWARHRGRVVTVASLWELNAGLSEPLDLGAGNEMALRTKLGKLIAGLKDRRFGGLRVTAAGVIQGARRWRLVDERERGGLPGRS